MAAATGLTFLSTKPRTAERSISCSGVKLKFIGQTFSDGKGNYLGFIFAKAALAERYL
jgi:hypothetical protein